MAGDVRDGWPPRPPRQRPSGTTPPQVLTILLYTALIAMSSAGPETARNFDDLASAEWKINGLNKYGAGSLQLAMLSILAALKLAKTPRAFRGGLWQRGRSVARRSSCVAGRSVAAAFLPISKPPRVAGRSVAAAFLPIRQARRPSRSSCVAGRSVAAAAFLPISKPRAFRGGLWRRGRSVARRSSCVAGRSVAAAFLPISKPRALRGGLWRQARRPFRSSCAAGRSVATGAVCGEKK